MKTVMKIFAVFFIVFLSAQSFSQEIGSVRKSIQTSFPGKIQSPADNPLAAGIYTIGSSGDFPTIGSALNTLSLDGIAGPVTLELIDNLYTSPADTFGFRFIGPIPGSGPDSRVTIKPAINKNVIIQGSGQTVMCFVNTSFMTLDGVSLTGPTTLTIHALYDGEYYWNDCLDFINNSDHNIVQNITFISEDFARFSSGVGFWRQNGITETPDSNLIENNFIKMAGIGIYVSAFNSNNRATGNIIRGNKIGSETDSLITWGIQVEMNQGAIIENNIVQNIRQQMNCFITPGINSCADAGCVIRNNVVHNIWSNNFYGCAGILLSGDGSTFGSGELVYNNMIYDIRSVSTYSDSRVAGIEMYYQNNPEIYFNSVYLSGAGSNQRGSAALYIYSQCTNVKAENNILVNTRDETPYCASSIFDNSPSNLSTNYNDLFYLQSQYNCLVKAGGSNYNTLSEWQITGEDLNSITEMPNFINPYLHIAGTATLLKAHATPIADIDKDFDGDMRNITNPDIGADEFSGINGVEDEAAPPSGFILAQNYPNPFNPSTIISWQAPVGSWQSLKVYDVLGNEVATLVDEYKSAGKYEVEFSSKGNAYNISSGVYFYRLQAGDYVVTNKMILLR